MGSHKSSSDRNRASRKGRSGGSGGGAGEGKPEKAEQRTARNKIFEVATSRVNLFLQEKQYTQAASLGTKVAFWQTPPQEAVVVLLAGLQALRTGKKQEWKPKPEDLAMESVASSIKVTNHELSLEKRQFITELLASELKKAAKGGS